MEYPAQSDIRSRLLLALGITSSTVSFDIGVDYTNKNLYSSGVCPMAGKGFLMFSAVLFLCTVHDLVRCSCYDI